MPANKRPRRLNYAVNKKGPIWGSKVTKAINHYKRLQQRIGFEGQTKWLENAVEVVSTKLKKYGIKTNTL